LLTGLEGYGIFGEREPSLIIVQMTASAIRHEEDHFDAADGRRLYEQRWLPESARHAHLAIVHGFAEHSGRYAYTAEALARRGYAVHALDLRGHGRSEGDRAYVRSANEYLLDVRAFLERVRERAAGRPVFLLGHSLGGAIVALALCVEPPGVRGALLSGAVLPVAPTLGSRIQRWIALALGRLAPRLPTIKLKSSDVSRDPEQVAKYDSDPLNYRGRIRAGLAAAMTRAVDRIKRDVPQIRMPLLIMHGTADALANPDGSIAFYERVASADKTLKLYEGLYHEILNEPERDQVIADIAAWMDARL
jgi:alpha-beta hydrolase superfamily lysophospholipase